MAKQQVVIRKMELQEVSKYQIVDPLSCSAIVDRLESKFVGSEIVVLESATSTSDVAWQRADGKGSNGLAVFAESQSAGRGRRGNEWFAKAGQSVLCSIVLKDIDLSANVLTVLSAVAVVDVLEGWAIKAGIKWPNDVLVGGRKICGILVEARDGNFVVGIGINCHQSQDDWPDDLAYPITSIDLASNGVCDRVEVASGLLNSFERWIEVAKTRPSDMIEIWKSKSTIVGKAVNLRYNNSDYSGVCQGFDSQQGLIVRLDDGQVRNFDAAHTTILR